MLPLSHILVNSLILYPFIRKKSKKAFAYVAFGSILPDLVDKPLGLIIYHAFGNGRLVAHSLLFNVLLLLVCIAAGEGRWLIGVSSLLHLVEDQMWKMPDVLFFPFLGPIHMRHRENFTERINSLIHHLYNPFYLFLNVAGFVFVVYILLKKRN